MSEADLILFAPIEFDEPTETEEISEEIIDLGMKFFAEMKAPTVKLAVPPSYYTVPYTTWATNTSNNGWYTYTFPITNTTTTTNTTSCWSPT